MPINPKSTGDNNLAKITIAIMARMFRRICAPPAHFTSEIALARNDMPADSIGQVESRSRSHG